MSFLRGLFDILIDIDSHSGNSYTGRYDSWYDHEPWKDFGPWNNHSFWD